MTQIKPMTLIILDGWGHSEESEGNAILAANTPNWDKYQDQHSHTLIGTSGADVGLPDGQMGNSEVGHLNLGAGRIVDQDFTRITKAMQDGSFADNEAINNAITKVKASGGAVHVMGLLSPGGVHSHEDHIFTCLEILKDKGLSDIYLHGILDGRDTPPQSAKASIEKAEEVFTKLGTGRIATLSGRYYAMDRDNRWDRVAMAYQLYTQGKTDVQVVNATEALAQSYARDENDEFVKPVQIGDQALIKDGDAVIFMNYRSDRAREITKAFTDGADFDGFERGVVPKLCDYLCLTQYQKGINASIAFAPMVLKNVFAEYLSEKGLKQLHIAETEKYAHVTFFFNGGVEEPYAGEDRILVKSPDVATYDLQPEMNADEVTDKLVKAVEDDTYDVIICNYANADMVGHTGSFDAAVKSVEALDNCIGRVVEAVLKQGGELLITADHGNVEKMSNAKTGQAHTAHTVNPVPLLAISGTRKLTLQSGGRLCDIVPTLLCMMDMDQPTEMTGHSLFDETAS